ncbi:DUF3617 domain-containing protein [Ramlibacter sp. H39-3-26]|uniref:DUF3617 domain-containing protein n=1 Tax=Curvibacter soli TaxID=3031331 RepID=UPI0023D99D78|nr:DUF3617 domain-containing protein [Ramlibacter sp. H39-3-26]MDF1486274.1 DUF3617 domain-containing protein [Ramlibacter sp. H39-3-26]
MLAQRGMSMSPGGGHGMRVCSTPEMAARQEAPVQQKGHCTIQATQRSAAEAHIAFTCTDPAAQGDGSLTFDGPRAYKMHMVTNATVQGQPRQHPLDVSGKWLAAHCAWPPHGALPTARRAAPARRATRCGAWVRNPAGSAPR